MICQQEPDRRSRSRMKLRHESGLAILRNVIERITPKRAGRQEAHVFKFYTVMKRIAATAAVGALVVAATLQPAHGQGAAAAPKKEYKPGEFELYDAAAKSVAAQNFAKAITDLETWKQKVPASDYADERSVLLIQSYGGAKQFDKVLAEAEPMLAKDLDKVFPDPKGGPGQVLAVLLTSSVAIQNIPQPSAQQLATADKAARML